MSSSWENINHFPPVGLTALWSFPMGEAWQSSSVFLVHSNQRSLITSGMCTVITPMLNSIYSLSNKDVMSLLERLFHLGEGLWWATGLRTKRTLWVPNANVVNLSLWLLSSCNRYTSFPLFPKHLWLAYICLCVRFSTASSVTPWLPFFPNYSTKFLPLVALPIGIPEMTNIRWEALKSDAGMDFSKIILSNVNIHIHLLGYFAHKEVGWKGYYSCNRSACHIKIVLFYMYNFMELGHFIEIFLIYLIFHKKFVFAVDSTLETVMWFWTSSVGL